MGKLTLSTLWKKSILLSLYFHLCSIVVRKIDLGNIFLEFRLLQLITDDHFLVSLEFIQLTIHWALKRRGFSEAASALLCKIDVKILVLFVLTKEISSTYSVVKLILPFFFYGLLWNRLPSGVVDAPHCQCSNSVWTVLSFMFFRFLCGSQAVWRSLPTELLYLNNCSSRKWCLLICVEQYVQL